jgi:hypothetical protein
MKALINLTPHPITILDIHDEIIVVIPASGRVARATSSRVEVGVIDLGRCGLIPINRTTFGEVEGLPHQEDDVVYIVSAITAQAVPHRKDVFITDDAVRNEEGHIIGCRALAHI